MIKVSTNNNPFGWAYIALFLFLSCGRRDILTDPVPTITTPRTPTEIGQNRDKPLHKAILGQADLASLYPFLQATTINQPDKEGNTPLHRAVIQDNLPLVGLLLSAEATIDAQNAAGLTPLHLAAKQGNLLTLHLLLIYYANIHAKDKEGHTPLDYINEKQHTDELQQLLQRTPWDTIASERDPFVVAWLLAAQKTNTKDNQGWTPLHLAACLGQVEAIQDLIANKADIEAKNNNGWTPLHLAAFLGQLEAIQALVANRAFLEAKTSQGWTPLHLAALAGQVETVQLLIGHQAPVDAIDYKGKTPYDIAGSEAVKQLLATQQPSGATDLRQISLAKLIFHCDYGNIGKRILRHVPKTYKGHLRSTYTGMSPILSHEDALHLSLRPDRLQDMRLQDYPRLYPHTQQANAIIFHPISIDALVQNTSDLKTILKDTRFIPKRVIFKGGLEGLKAVCDLLPPTVESMEIATGIPLGKKVDLSPYQHLKAIKVRDNPPNIVLPKGAVVLHTFSDEELAVPNKKVQPPLAPVDPNNAVFNSFIGVNKIPTGAIKIGWCIGAGGFGQVYRGSWGERPVALKKLGFDDIEKGLVVARYQWAEDLSWEIGRLSTLAHPNVAQFYGIYQAEKEGYTYLVLELCEGGDLKKALETKGAAITWSKRWQWALEISEALAYLHSQGIVHRDLKSDNVLLDRNGRAKLVDLGVAQVDKLLEDKESGSVVAGVHALGFIAPENVNDAALSTKATDIYALGLVFWQIATQGGMPRWIGKLEDFSPEREPIPADCPQSFKELMLDCWQLDPDKRPSARELVDRLAALGDEFNPGQHVLIKACQELEKLIHPKRKEGLSYIAPFVTTHRLEEPVETYWTRIEAAQAKGEKAGDHPLELKETFNEFITSSGSSTLLLLGEAGLGKTLTTYQWGDQLLDQWWAHINTGTPAPTYFPIFIRPEVRTWSHARIKDAFQEVVRKYNLPPGIAPLVFIDGYDELQLDEAPTALVEHVGLQETGGSKLIVTCRPNTVEQSALKACFGFNGVLTTCYFLPFSVDQLLSYLQQELSWEEKVYQDYQKTLADAEAVRTVLRTPFVLHLFKQSWETLSKRPLDQLNRWQIYEGFIEHSIKSSKAILSKKVQKWLQGGYPDLLTSYQAFMSEVAWRAFQQRGITLGWKKAGTLALSPWALLKKYAKKESQDGFREQQAKLEVEINQASEEKKAQWARRSLLSEADYVALNQKRVDQFEAELPLKLRGKRKEKHYEYSHKSLFEYGMAKQLLLLQNSPNIVKEAINLLNSRKIQEELEALQFWQEGWKEPGSEALIEPFFALITASRDNESIQQASANSATLLAQAEVAFSGRALQGVWLPGADLSGAVLSHTSLAGAHLQNATLREVYLGNTDLRDANLSGIDFGQYPSLKCKKTVYCLSHHPAGTQLAVGLEGGNIELYNQAEGAYTLLATLTGHTNDVNSIAYRPDGQQLASASDDKTVGLWDPSSKQLLAQLKGHSRGVLSVCYRPDGQQLASGSEDDTVGLWDPSSKQLLAQLKGHSGWVRSVCYRPDGQQLASGSSDNTVGLWDPSSKQLLAQLKGHSDGVLSVCYRPDGLQLASGSSDKTVGLWDGSSKQLLAQLKGHSGWVRSVCYRPDGQQLASGSSDKTVGLWDGSSKQLLAQLKGHSGWVWSVCYRPDGQQLASGSSDKTVGLWDGSSKQLLAQLKGHSGWVMSVCYRPDGQQLASGSLDNTVGLWDPSSKQLLAQLKGHSGWVMSVCYRPDGQQLASGSSDKTVGLWDGSSKQLLAQLKGHSGGVSSVCYRPDGLQLASGSEDKTVGLWDGSSKQLLAQLKGHSGGVSSVCYRPDGLQLASGSEDKTVGLWDGSSKQLLAQLKGHSGGVWSVCYRPDGQQLASASLDKTVGLWDPSSHQQLALLKGHSGGVLSVCYRPDGQQLVSGSADQSICVWARQDTAGSLQENWQLIHRFESGHSLLAPGALLKGANISVNNRALLKQKGAQVDEDVPDHPSLT